MEHILIKTRDLHLEDLAHHTLGLAEVAPAKQDVVIQDVVDVVHDLPLLVPLRQGPLLFVPTRRMREVMRARMRHGRH